MPQPNDLSRSLAAVEQDITLIAVIEMSQSSWLVAGIVPGIERHPLKKLEPDEAALLRTLRPARHSVSSASQTAKWLVYHRAIRGSIRSKVRSRQTQWWTIAANA